MVELSHQDGFQVISKIFQIIRIIFWNFTTILTKNIQVTTYIKNHQLYKNITSSDIVHFYLNIKTLIDLQDQGHNFLFNT